jgi:hypothetical protein
MHNDVIKSNIHSTDMHGYSEVIFAATIFPELHVCTSHQRNGPPEAVCVQERKNNCYTHANSSLVNERFFDLMATALVVF